MTKTAVILQPGYLPWLGFFDLLQRSDMFVIYDDVQYDKGSWRNRNRIKTANGTQWLTVPVLVSFGRHPLINEVRIDNKINWQKKHLSSIRQNYSKSPFFKKYIGIFEDAYDKRWELLVNIDMHFIKAIAECLGIREKKMVLSSSLGIEGGKIERLINICKSFGANTFYEGSAGRNYIDDRDFLSHYIKVLWHDYKHPYYSQLWLKGQGFISYLSVIDLLFNHGPDSLDIITGKKVIPLPENIKVRHAEEL